MLAQIEAIPTFTTWEKYITWVPKSKIKEVLEHTVADYSCLEFNIQQLLD